MVVYGDWGVKNYVPWVPDALVMPLKLLLKLIIGLTTGKGVARQAIFV